MYTQPSHPSLEDETIILIVSKIIIIYTRRIKSTESATQQGAKSSTLLVLMTSMTVEKSTEDIDDFYPKDNHHDDRDDPESYPSRRGSNVSTTCDIQIMTEKEGNNMPKEIWEDMKRRLNQVQIYLGLDDDEDYFLRHAGDANSDDDDDDDNDTVTTVPSITSIASNSATDIDVNRRMNNEKWDENYYVVRVVDR